MDSTHWGAYWITTKAKSKVQAGEYLISPAVTNVRYFDMENIRQDGKVATSDPIMVLVGREGQLLDRYAYYPPGDGFSVMFSWDGTALKIDQTFQIIPEDR